MLHEVTLTEMLEAREARAYRQQELLAHFQKPVISFSMNIAGPVKDSALIRRGFSAGLEQMDAALCAARLKVLHREVKQAVTGCEAMLCADADALEIKHICTAIEDANELGRLFDMDVISPDGMKLDRDAVNGGARCCIVCGVPGRGCASRRVHSVPELQAATKRILTAHFYRADCERAAALATRALLDEVCTTPKPGLVDRANNGSHADMDIFTFTASAAALAPYWGECFRLGQDTADDAPENVFRKLRALGQQAERTMFAATGGINTHKGAIFTLGTICCAAGRCWTAETPAPDAERIGRMCAALSESAMRADFDRMQAEESHTAGGKLYRKHGLTGARGEIASGLPNVLNTALPELRAALAAGLSRNDAGASALMHLIAATTDTNMVSRGGMQAARAASEAAAELLRAERFPASERIAALDGRFRAERLSPGGCADLLAAAFFLNDWTEQA